MLAYKMRSLLAASARVSPEQARTQYENEETTVDFMAVQFEPRRYSRNLTLSEADIEAFAASNADEIQKKYELDKTLYSGRPKEVRVRHIFIESQQKLDDTAQDMDEEVADASAADAPAGPDPARTEAEAVLARLEGGADFAKVAAEVSDESSTAAQGGDMGWRPLSAMGIYGPELQKAVDTAQVGKLSEVIESDQGYHIVVVEDAREGDLGYEQVKLELAENMLREKRGAELAKQEAEASLERAREGWELGQQYEVAPASRGFQGLPPGIQIPGLNAPQQGSLWPLGLDHDTALAQTVAGDAPRPEPEVGAKVKPEAKKQARAAGDAKDEEPARPAPSALPDEARPKVRQYKGVRRDGTQGPGTLPVPAVESSSKLRTLLFGKLEPGTLAPEVIEVDGSYWVVKLDSRQDADMALFAQKQPELVSGAVGVPRCPGGPGLGQDPLRGSAGEQQDRLRRRLRVVPRHGPRDRRQGAHAVPAVHDPLARTLTVLWAALGLLGLQGCKSRPVPSPPDRATTEAPAPAPADADAPRQWISLAPGIEHRVYDVAGTTVLAYRADLAVVRMLAADARTGDREAATVAELADETGAALLVNGTFFDPAGKPLGLLVVDGIERNPLRKADWGVFEAAGRTARIVHTSEYTPAKERTAALQVGPRVVIDGKVPGLKPERAHRRTALCVPSPATVIVLVVPGRLTTKAMGEFLATSEDAGGPGCLDAMLLDGGPSTQLAVRLPDHERDIPGGWPVPNAIGFEFRRGRQKGCKLR